MVTDIIIIGGGAAGLFAAASSVMFAKTNKLPLPSITILEKMERCGKKIGITGKGRCNLTNTKEWNEFSTHIFPDKNFFKPSFFEMSNLDTMKFFEDLGLPLVTERGDRVFPASMRASDVTDTLLAYIKKSGVKIINNAQVVKVIVSRESNVQNLNSSSNIIDTVSAVSSERRFLVEIADGRRFLSDYVVLSSGGLSYPATGSSGDGYVLAESLGHAIVKCFPSLTALIPNNYSNLKLSGLSLKNISVSLLVNGTVVQSEFGDLDFTEDGIEGPVGIKISRKAVYNLINGQKVSVILDLKPSLTDNQINARIVREHLDKENNLNILLSKFMPVQLVKPFIAMQSPVSVSNLADKLKHITFNINSFVGYRRSVVTAGGIDLKEVSKKTMQSRVVEGLFFAGEVLNLDADTGGYNLQVAFSTAALAAKSILKEIAANR